MKKKSAIIYLVLVLLIFAIPMVSSADSDPFAGGTGTSDDPYKIETKQQLSAVREYRESSFVLTKDIVFDDTDFESGGEFYNNGKLWKSICSPNYFKGTFDGNGHKISNLHLSGDAGLFYSVDSGSVIKNLTLENVKKINPGYGVIGMSNYGTIENCVVSGTIHAGTSSGMVAGLVGINKSTGIIRNCCNTATICGRNALIGGIAAKNEGNIVNCYNAGNVAVKCSDSLYYSGIGGIAGTSNGTIENCYNAGYLNPSYNILPGGIVGAQTDSAILINSYTVSNFDSNDIGVKLDITEMKTISAFSGFDFENTWELDTDCEYPFPYLKSSGVPVISAGTAASGGTGTNYDPYRISKAADLDAVRKNLGACYIMTSDVDLSSYEDWDPIGVCYNSFPEDDDPFVGSFLGGGHKVTGMTSSQGGLFGANEGLISGIVIEKAYVTPQDTDMPFGAVAGTNEGIIESCVNKADFNISSDEAGGITGLNYSMINKCANQGTIVASISSDATGGIAGENRGYIMKSYNCGKIAGDEAGGIAGSTYIENGIDNVFNLGNITGISYAGGIVSDVPSNKVIVNNAYNAGIVAGNYRGAIIPKPQSDTAAIGKNVYSVAYHSNDAGVTALNLIELDEMDNQASFAGFDFDNVWTMGTGDYTFPCFSEIETPVWGRPDDNFDGGTGTLADPYLVSNLTQLEKIQDDTSNHFKLTKDLDLGDEIWNPVSDMYLGKATGFFGGVLDGNNKIISNMKCDSEAYSNGFVTANVGVIKNLNLHNVRVQGSNSCVGAVAGQNYSGQIYNCGVYGDLELMKYESDLTNTKAGGIAGTNSGTIERSFFSGTIRIMRETYSVSYAGGISGSGGGDIRDCYSYLFAYGPQNAYRIGGIAGSSGIIDNTYSVCNFNGLTDSSWKPYGISYNATVTDSYYTKGQSIEGDRKLSLPEMQDKSSFVGFDFDNVWEIYEGTTPRLKGNPVVAESMELTVPVCEYEVGNIIEDISVKILPVNVPLTEVKITSSNETVLQSNGDGTLTAVGAGKAEIIAEYGKVSDSKEITVYPATEKICVMLDGKEMTETYIYMGSTHTVGGAVSPEGANNQFIYSSKNTNVVSVTDGGVVRGLSCGTADLAVTNSTSAVKGTIMLHVVGHIPDTVNTEDMEMVTGQSQKAEYGFSPSENIVDPEFESSEPGVASVTSTGKITAHSAGTAIIKITFDNGFEQISEEFVVTVKSDIAQETVKLGYKSVRYNGTKRCPSVKIEGLKSGVDYSVKYSNNLYPGTATVKITGKGKYYGQISKTFTVSPPLVAAQKNVSINLKPKTGYKNIKATWSTQKVTGAKVKYIVQYKKSGGSWYYASKGTTAGSISVKGLAAGKQYYFKVTPYVVVDGVSYKGTAKTSAGVYTLKKPTNVKLSKHSKSYIKVKWTGMNGESGYQIQRSKHAKYGFTNVKEVSSKYSSGKIKTTKKKKYYYRVRAYKKVGESIVYGPWSAVKSYTLK